MGGKRRGGLRLSLLPPFSPASILPIHEASLLLELWLARSGLCYSSSGAHLTFSLQTPTTFRLLFSAGLLGLDVVSAVQCGIGHSLHPHSWVMMEGNAGKTGERSNFVGCRTWKGKRGNSQDSVSSHAYQFKIGAKVRGFYAIACPELAT